MLGRTLFHFSGKDVKTSARRFAEKALEIDPNYTPGVALLAEIYQAEGDSKSAIKLLEMHLERSPRANLFSILGDIMRSEKQFVKALEYYYLALGYVLCLPGILSIKYNTFMPDWIQNIGKPCWVLVP